MADDLQKTATNPWPIRFGIVSLLAAALAFGSNILVVIVGIAIWLAVLSLLVVVGVVCGLLGVATGGYERNFPAVVSSVLGLAFMGFVVWWAFSNLTHW